MDNDDVSSSTSVCDRACVGCMGSGLARCKKCATGYRLTGVKCLGTCWSVCVFGCFLIFSMNEMQYVLFSLSLPDINECSERVLACSGLDEICTNEEGSFRCDCAEGFSRKDNVCEQKHLPSE